MTKPFNYKPIHKDYFAVHYSTQRFSLGYWY